MPRPNSAPRVDAAQRDAQALELRAGGASYRQIAERLGVSVSTAWECVDRGLDRTRREPADRLRQIEAERLDRLQVEALQVLQARHYVVQGGEVVAHNGQELVDHGPTLAAIRTLLAVAERRAKLEGLDAPQQVGINARVHAEVYSVDALDRELERVQAELAEQDPDWAERERHSQDHETKLRQFTVRWSSPGEVVRDPASFIGQGLALLLEGLQLPDDQKEAAGVEVERLLWTRQAAR